LGRTARAAAAAPFPRTRRQAVPAVTHLGDRACRSGPAVLPRRAILTPCKDHNQGRTSSLCCGRSTMILTFHGKNRQLAGGRGRLKQRCGLPAPSLKNWQLTSCFRSARGRGDAADRGELPPLIAFARS
jgi:hypothetical protein